MNVSSRSGSLANACSPTALEGFDSLAELALDLRWSWNHATDEVWRQLDPKLWEVTQNPWAVLQTVSRDKIQRVLADPVFRKGVDELVQTRRQEIKAPAWFQQNHPQAPLTCAAYFSMEFMLSEALPIYSGGAWQCSRRSAQSVQRSWHSSGRRGAVVSARLFPSGD